MPSKYSSMKFNLTVLTEHFYVFLTSRHVMAVLTVKTRLAAT